MNNDNTNLIGLLQSIDVPRNEAVTYASLLQLESVSIRKVAAATGINRGTTYDALKNLVGIGLVSVKSDNGKRERYTAETPERIYDLIRDKRRDLLDASNNAKNIVPNLLAGNTGPAGKPLVRYYEGDEGVATILKDVLQTCRELSKREYHAYSSDRIRQYLYREYPQFTDRRIAEDIIVKVVAVGANGSGGEAALSERKLLPNVPSQGISSYTLIYGPKVATISITSNNIPYGVVVEDAGAAAMQRLLFEQLWAAL
jgi:sugar-specific transcriptional regulator TrmB